MNEQLKIKPLSASFIAPSYATPGSAAFDLRSNDFITLKKGQSTTIGLGFAAQVPDGHVALLMPRSGFGSKYGMGLRNTVGVIDSDYRGEWMATITRDNCEPTSAHDSYIDSVELHIAPGDRILQCMIVPVSQVDFIITNELDETERGTGGYGSTGIK